MRPHAYRPRFGFDIRINREARHPAAAKRCAIKGCPCDAEMHVPKSRDNLEERFWLCREHVREHNAQWDYFAGMSDKEIERFCIDALTGHRPTWPLGKRTANRRDRNAQATAGRYRFEDGFAIFEEAAEPEKPRRVARLTKTQLDALAVLHLEENATLHQIKARYKELVKRFHPDANGGNRGTEERLRQVIKAYGHLRATGLA